MQNLNQYIKNAHFSSPIFSNFLSLNEAKTIDKSPFVPK